MEKAVSSFIKFRNKKPRFINTFEDEIYLVKFRISPNRDGRVFQCFKYFFFLT